MSEIINLNKQRKAKNRSDKEKTASKNRMKFGRTKEEKKLEKLKADKAKKLLDAHKRETDAEQ